MKLQLRYNNQLHHETHAAVLHGSDAGTWLKQISSWNIDSDQLDCYILPRSIQSIEAAGLFVVFKNRDAAKQVELLEPYTRIGDRLFIPLHTELSPQVSAKELNDLLLWDVQAFHPSIGLIGYDPASKLDIADLFLFTENANHDWSFAHPGTSPNPPLQQILITPPSAEEIMKDLKEDIKQKPLQDIPVREEEKMRGLEKAANTAAMVLLMPFMLLANLLGRILPAPTAGNGSTGQDNGWFTRFQNWIERNMEELQKKRNDELKRLLNLFDHDTNEALQFAIPLDSPYLNRGSQAVSSTLTRRPLNFNLGRLGGGGVVDSWDVGDYYHDLRTKYLNAAQKEIAQKDFKKAAYIYAHLLGDYNGAANVLEQGKMYREAAALYKDHLKNIPAAAECLERGGLYQECIDLYKELNRDEKVGDLYKILQQHSNAEQYYENAVSTRMAGNDHLEASRIIHEKLEQEERAQEILLLGWKESSQSETCLKKYFDIESGREDAVLENKMRTVYREHTSPSRNLALLNVLEYVVKKDSHEGLVKTSQDIAYEIVNAEADKGNMQALHSLRKFLPNDRLIASDTSRYSSRQPVTQLSTAMPQLIQLDNSIKWIKADWHRNQFLVIGVKEGRLHLARANWYGNVEYYFWEGPVVGHSKFSFISAPYFDQLILQSTGDTSISRKNLPRNKYFNHALLIHCPVWLHGRGEQVLLQEDGKINRLEIKEGSMTLHEYSLHGDLVSSIDCELNVEWLGKGTVYQSPSLVFHEGYFYTYTDQHFIRISSDGKSLAANLQTGIRMIAASQYMIEFHVVISTNRGCLLFSPVNGSFFDFPIGFFAEKLIPIFISFISAKIFVLGEKRRATVFEIVDGTPQQIAEFSSYEPLVSVLPAGERNKLALITGNGQITIHSLPAFDD